MVMLFANSRSKQALVVRLAMLIVCLLAASCSDSTSVDYYYNHQLEAREKVKECKNEPEGLNSSNACLNAVQALRKFAKTVE